MYFKNSSKLVFSFQVALLNSRFVNKLKIMEPINKTKFFFFSFFFSYEPTSLSFFLLLLFLSFSLSLNKIVLFYYAIITFFKKNKYMYQIHNYIFSYFKICYLKYDTKYIFLQYEYLKLVFSQYFLNHSFHIDT